ncbi:MAG: hypothetical protein IJT98_09180 [Prevotella sp.]|nr:hypothetical protein [Prevotella sp.]
MKKKIYSILAAATLCMGAAAQSVTVDDVEALSSGETVTFGIHYSGVSSMTSTHFELNLPAGFTVDKVEATSCWSALFSHEGGVVSGMSTSANAFSGDGDIASMTVTIPAGTAVGSYPVSIANVRINGTDLGSEPSFTINVVTAHTVVLDENSTTAPAPAAGVNVTVKRTINANEWSTICLPFAMTEAQVTEAFGSDVQIADFTGYETTEDDEENIVGIEVTFNSGITSIEANHPYIIKVSAPVSEFTAEGVDIDPEDEPCVSFGTTTGKGKNAVYHPQDFNGTYVAEFSICENATSEYPLFLSGGKLWYATSATLSMKAFRAYFDFDDVLSEVENAPARITMSFGDDTTTGISGAALMNNEERIMNNEVYDLQGRRVEEPARGLYIRDGKVFIVK